MKAKKQKPQRVNNPTRGADGRFIRGPALEAGALDMEPESETHEPNPEQNKDDPMKTSTPAPEQSFKDKAMNMLTTPVSAVTPDCLASKVPAGVKSVMDKTPASAVVAGLGVLAYGIYRKFFKKTTNVQ